MARSPSHRFGQIVGDLLEEIMEPYLQEFCNSRGLYLDKKGSRGSARIGKKLTWEDKYGNNHDLDFVIENGGSIHEKGRPVAFIEAAWRRYTKHSRNKAQEIQGAILPIAEKYEWDKPFLGAVLAGVFTKGSLSQMKSSGFEVALFPYEVIVSAFREVEINAEFDESTPDAEFEETVKKIEDLEPQQRQILKSYLIKNNELLLQCFIKELEATLDREVKRITLIPLHGGESDFSVIGDAIAYIENYNEEANGSSIFRKYEVIVRYSNEDKIDAEFSDKKSAIRFLEYVAKG